MPARFCIQYGYLIEERERMPARYSINMCMRFYRENGQLFVWYGIWV